MISESRFNLTTLEDRSNRTTSDRQKPLGVPLIKDWSFVLNALDELLFCTDKLIALNGKSTVAPSLLGSIQGC